jgi:hypothetical protein
MPLRLLLLLTFLASSILLTSTEAHAQLQAIAVKLKADKSVKILNEKIEAGCNVNNIVPKMKRVKTLADKGKLEKADKLLNEILSDFEQLDCNLPKNSTKGSAFIDDKIATVEGYTGSVMEAFITRDGKYLFFNDDKTKGKDKDIYWAERINDYKFTFKGEIKNINTDAVEGVPTMDNSGNFFFVSGHKYSPKNLVTMYQGTFDNGSIVNIKPLPELSLNKAGWLNMDSEISADGNTLYSTQTYFGDGAPPTKSYFFYAKKIGDKFIPQEDSDFIFKEINKDEVVYGLTISKDELEILYTRLLPGFKFESLRSTRKQKNMPFRKPKVIGTITGFSEAPAFNSDESLIYYHKKSAKDGLFDLHVLHRNTELEKF